MTVLRLSILSLALTLLSGIAQAEMVASEPTFRDLQFVDGVSLNSTSFEVSEAGAFTVSLIDYAFPDTFDELTVAITDAAASFFVAQVRAGVDPTQIVLDTAGTYVASVFASVEGTGLYALSVTPADLDVVIPLPAGLWLLLSGLGLLAATRRRAA